MLRDLGYYGGISVFLISFVVDQWTAIENTLMKEEKGDVKLDWMEVGMAAATEGWP